MSFPQPYASKLTHVAWVPGLPHVLRPELNDGYQKLNDAARNLGQHLASTGTERILYYSTQWLSVLGQMVQSGKSVEGCHIDENWYHLSPDLEFSFDIDTEFAAKLGKRFQNQGLATMQVDYEGFPVDTGTLVADRLINPNRLPTTMVASHVYSDFAATKQIAQQIRQEIEASDRKTAVVVVSSLSQRWFTEDIDLANDQIREPADDEWNRRILATWEEGRRDEAERLTEAYAKEARVDMGFKGYALVQGLLDKVPARPANCAAYEAVYGTGAAVVVF